MCELVGPEDATGKRIKKALPVPRSLPELQQAAALHLFGGVAPNRLRFFHKGREILCARTLANIQDGDQIIARKFLNSCSQEVVEPTRSTHETDFIRFATVEKTQALMSRETANKSEVASMTAGTPFDGTSCYTDSYVKHPVSTRVQKMQGMQVSHMMPLTDKTEHGSSYAEHFVKYEAFERTRPLQGHASVISNNTLGKTFQAETGYKTDFHRQRDFRQEMPERVVFHDNDSTLTDAVRQRAFAGQSTYAGHYTLFSKHERSVSARPEDMALRATPFDGGSEYRSQYLGIGHNAAKNISCDLVFDPAPPPQGKNDADTSQNLKAQMLATYGSQAVA